MSRKNIFDVVSGSFDIAHELQRIRRLFEAEHPVYVHNIRTSCSVFRYVDKYGFYQWSNRGRCVDANDFLSILGYEELWKSASTNLQDLLTLIEIIYNFCWIVKEAAGNMKVSIDGSREKHFSILEETLTVCLSQYNYKGEYFPELEQLIVIEDKPEATAVAEIVDNDLSYKVLRYNHYMLKGDLQTKKDILLALGADLEPKREQIKAIDKDLEDGIFYILNNMNLRHNNTAEGDKHYRQAVVNMDSATLENWYDELYQMMLLAYLQMDQVARNAKVKTLKQAVSPK
ncbi:MAG: hypothetical protein E7468_03455 [Ruminococcaceae bacterium]|nr:hypothetical protein [Oscillospiraceae bacterium]